MSETAYTRRRRLGKIALQFDLDTDEAQRVREIADQESMSVATLLRRWVRQRLREDRAA